MAITYKILGQSKPVATTLTTLYTVPALTSAVISSLTICNLSATATSFRIAVIPSGESIADKHYFYYDVLIGGNDTFIFTGGITMATGDKIEVYSTLATLSFNLFGNEIT